MSNLISMPGDPEYVVPGSDEWHDHIGCSQVASILGHGYETANDLWLKMTHRAADPEHMKIWDRGHDMEPKMAADVRAAGRVLKGEQVQYRDPERPWLIYHADGMFPKWTPLHDGDKELHGVGVFEAKAPGWNMTRKMEEDGMTGGYIDQTQIGMHVASAAAGQMVSWATFGYLDYDQYETVLFDCPANVAYQQECLKIIDAFWKCVQTDTPPTPIHPDELPVPPPVNGTKQIITTGALPALLESLARLEDDHNLKQLKATEKAVRDELKHYLNNDECAKDFELFEVPGQWRVSHKWGKSGETVGDPMGLLAYCEHLVNERNEIEDTLADELNGDGKPITFRRSDWIKLVPAKRTFRPTRLEE